MGSKAIKKNYALLFSKVNQSINIFLFFRRGAHAVVLVYDVTKESSLRALELWLEELEQHGVCREVPRILVGNKCDEGDQQVPTAAAQRWADDRYQTRFTI